MPQRAGGSLKGEAFRKRESAGRQIGLQCVCVGGAIGGGVETDETKASTVSESCLPLDRRVVTLWEGILRNRS